MVNHSTTATPEHPPGPFHLGIVYGKSGIHFVAATRARDALTMQLADYVRRESEVQLYPADRAALFHLLESGADEAAVRFYFDRVGARWDREWLHMESVEVVDAADDHRERLPASVAR